jgi:hypothetical protein
MRSRSFTALLVLLFAVSLAGNVVLVRRPRSATVPSSPPPPEESPVAELRTQLAQCRGANLDLLVASFSGQHEVAARTPAAGNAGRPQPAEPKLVTPAVERDALSSIAIEHLRRSWEQSREPLSEILRREATDPQARAASLKRDVDEVAIALNLDESERSGFIERCSSIRTARLDAVAAEMTLHEPDLNLVFDQIRGLFADEDNLVRSRYGADSADLYRATQLDKRTATLAILATLANQPWDDHIIW